MTPRLSTIYATSDTFDPMAGYLARITNGTVLLLGLEGRGKNIMGHFERALDKYEIPYASYTLRQDGREENYKKVVNIRPKGESRNPSIVIANSLFMPGTTDAVILDDFIDTFENGAGSVFYALKERENLRYSGRLLVFVQYDLLGGVAHLSRNIRDPNKVVVGNRDRLLERLKLLGPCSYRDLESTGTLEHIGDIDPLIGGLCELEIGTDTGSLWNRVASYFSKKPYALGLKTSDTSEMPRKRSRIETRTDIIDAIIGGK